MTKMTKKATTKKTIKAAVFRVGKSPVVEEIGSDLEGYQKVVGGYIEAVILSGKLHLYCNEDGKGNGLPPNRRATTIEDIIVGDFFVVRGGVDGEDDDINPKDLPKLEKILLRV